MVALFSPPLVGLLLLLLLHMLHMLLHMLLLLMMMMTAGVPLVSGTPPVGGSAWQAAARRGKHRLLQTQTQLCDIGAMFAGLSEIKLDADCQAGCAGGSGLCPADWLPSAADECSAACGRVFEPFWDRCGTMLTNAGMGGMEEFGAFCKPFARLRFPAPPWKIEAHALTHAMWQMIAASRASIPRVSAAPSAVRTLTTATVRR